MTATISEPFAGVELTNQELISDQLWERLVSRIVKDENMERPLAGRIINEALGFLRLCATEPDDHYSPSPLVDIGWHTFILYTREYSAFCQELGGRFIHHVPSDEESVDYGSGNTARTVAALKKRGLVVDELLWVNTKCDCCGAGCSACSGGNAVMKVDCSSYCSGDSCSGGGGDGDGGCSH
jgi:hypothetical protein